jgi:hypothetical protein
MMLIPIGITDPVSADTITKFDGGNTEAVITFNSEGSNSDTHLLVPIDGTVTAASFEVTGMANGAYTYPNRVSVYLGSIDSTVYRWADRSYGPMGYQDRFTNFQTSNEYIFEDSGEDNTLTVRLPAGAQITNAELRATGAQHDAGWDYPVKLSHKVGNNYVPINVGNRPTPQLIDFDGDGDLDLLTGGYVYSGGVRWIFYFENTGTKSAPKWEEDRSVVGIPYNFNLYQGAPRFVDLDDDGDFDLVVGQRMGEIRVYWNTGSNAAPTWTDNGTGASSVFYGIDEGLYATPYFADMDDDDDLDMAYGRYSASGDEANVGVSSYENKYSSGTWIWSTASFFSGIKTDRYSCPTMTDFDGDGDYDIFVGNYNGTIGYYENTGSASSPKWTQDLKVQGNIDVGTMAGPATGDLDDDGDIDLIVGGTDGNFYFYEHLLSYPTDAVIDIGDDGDADWSQSGELSGSKSVTGLAHEFQSHLTGSYSKTDVWGNKFHDVKVSVSSKSAGKLTIDQLRIPPPRGRSSSPT